MDINNNNSFENSRYSESETTSVKDYINIIRRNLIPIILISIVGLTVAIIYAVNAQNIYNTKTTLQITSPKGNILESPLLPDMQSFGADRFIANEIEIAKSRKTREMLASRLIDTLKQDNLEDYSFLVFRENENSRLQIKPQQDIIKVLNGAANIEQMRGLDIITISVESNSPKEAAIVANMYAETYKNINLQNNRVQLISVKEFLQGQRVDKLQQLNQAEENLSSFQKEGGIVRLETQTESLIAQLSTFESQMNSAKVEMSIAEQRLDQLRTRLAQEDRDFQRYISSMKNEPYIKLLQGKIAQEELQRDQAVSGDNSTSPEEREKYVRQINKNIADLRNKLEERLNTYREGILATAPKEYKDLATQLFEAEINYQALKVSHEELQDIVAEYEERFDRLPKQIIGLARLERKRAAIEKLYLLLEEKYQEALINEQSTPGNVLIIDEAHIPDTPSKPNRVLIVVIGLFLGVGLGIGVAVLRNYMDNTVKTPEDIQKRGINVLTWIPQVEGLEKGDKKAVEFIVARRPDSIPSEAFRALRTRISFSGVDDREKSRTLLVTSCAPKEGKTIVSINLAGSFAQANKKVVVIDCDLRKPRLHSLMGVKKTPGLTDYLFGGPSLEEVTRKSELENLDYITSGIIPPNPSEILGSKAMHDFLEVLKEKYDMVILDSPPIIAVTDSEILSRMVHSTILVVSANTTEIDLMEKSVDLLQREQQSFLGVLLNNFSYKSGYGSYYKYYYYYSRPRTEKT